MKMAMQQEFKDEKIRLIHWREQPNFGDYLSPYLVSKLSCLVVLSKKAALPWKNFLKCLIWYPWLIYEYALPFQKNLLAVGSILNLGNSKSIIWGSGFMNYDDSFCRGKSYAIRGPLSERKIINMGGYKCGIYGDPALLLPIVYNPIIEKKHKIGIVPHWRETNYFFTNFTDSYIVDVRTDKVELVVDKILSCEKILATSLHGLIVAHAYGIPALWIKHADTNTDGFKFDDYFLSVGIKPYKGFSELEEIINFESYADWLFDNNKDVTLPQCSVKEIQRKLLATAPFPLKKQYEHQ